MQIRPSKEDDQTSILELYRRVALVPGGLARLESEIDEDFVDAFLTPSLDDGISLLAQADDGRCIGEIHAFSPGLYCFSHIFSSLTIAVDPDVQSKGVGRRLFDGFMAELISSRPDITRVELIARESNQKAIRFYESLGFEREGEFVARIRNPDGSLESDIPMAWRRDSI